MTFLNLTVVSDDGSYFPATSAYLVDTTTFSEEDLEDFNDGPDSDRVRIAVANGIPLSEALSNGGMKFVSSLLIYSGDQVYDEEAPEYCYYVPFFTGRFYFVDCLVVDRFGKLHPDYQSGVRVAVHTLTPVGDNTMMPLPEVES